MGTFPSLFHSSFIIKTKQSTEPFMTIAAAIDGNKENIGRSTISTAAEETMVEGKWRRN